MDNFIVEIDNGEWWIYKEGFDFSKQSNYKGFSDNFAGSGLANGKIVYFFDIGISDEDIKKLKKDKLFLEECNFIYKNKSFKGTFIDALTLIKKEF